MGIKTIERYCKTCGNNTRYRWFGHLLNDAGGIVFPELAGHLVFLCTGCNQDGFAVDAKKIKRGYLIECKACGQQTWHYDAGPMIPEPLIGNGDSLHSESHDLRMFTCTKCESTEGHLKTEIIKHRGLVGVVKNES